MQDSTVGNRGAHRTGGITVVLVAALVAVFLAFVAAKPSEAQTPILTVNPSSVDVGNVQVGADPATRLVTITNTGGEALVLGGVEILGVDSGAFSTSIDPTTGLTVGAGGTATFTVSFDPLKTGLQTAQLTFNRVTDLLGTTVSGVQAPTVALTGQGVSANLAGSNCTITGSNNSETLRGTAGKDVICALGGNDKVNALGGNDKVLGGSGVGVLNGGTGADVVNGGSSKDLITGSKGNDRLIGGSGNDRIIDKAGKDKLYGQGGRDTLVTKDRVRGDLLVGGPQKDRVVKDARDIARSV
jgi:Ca2+-binding RTX toxin-like protein